MIVGTAASTTLLDGAVRYSCGYQWELWATLLSPRLSLGSRGILHSRSFGRRVTSARPEGTFVSAQSMTGNQLLAVLTAADFALLEPDLEAVDLPMRRQLERRNQPVEKVYFIDSGLGSMVMNASPNHMVEVGIIGSEGMTGFAVLLGAGTSTYETFIQSAGTGRRISAEKLQLAMAKSPTLQTILLRNVHVLITQMAYTALANARYKLEERLARWLLMGRMTGLRASTFGLPMNFSL